MDGCCSEVLLFATVFAYFIVYNSRSVECFGQSAVCLQSIHDRVADRSRSGPCCCVTFSQTFCKIPSSIKANTYILTFRKSLIKGSSTSNGGQFNEKNEALGLTATLEVMQPPVARKKCEFPNCLAVIPGGHWLLLWEFGCKEGAAPIMS